HAERILSPLVLASFNELRFDRAVVDLAGLPKRQGDELHENARFLWIEGSNLMGVGAGAGAGAAASSMWVPFELGHMNFTLPLPTSSGALLSSSNGLASGNHMLEAVSHAICEVVERDAMTLWRALDEDAREERKVDLSTVDDAGCRWVLDRFESAGCAFAAWE